MPLCVSTEVKYQQLTWIKHMWIFKNKKVVHLFTHNSTSFLYQTNHQWILYCKRSIVNLILIHNTKRPKVIFFFLLRLYLISQCLHSLHIVGNILHISYKKLIYKGLGLAWFKTQEASRVAIIFLTKFWNCWKLEDNVNNTLNSVHCTATLL